MLILLGEAMAFVTRTLTYSTNHRTEMSARQVYNSWRFYPTIQNIFSANSQQSLGKRPSNDTGHFDFCGQLHSRLWCIACRENTGVL